MLDFTTKLCFRIKRYLLRRKHMQREYASSAVEQGIWDSKTVERKFDKWIDYLKEECL